MQGITVGCWNVLGGCLSLTLNFLCDVKICWIFLSFWKHEVVGWCISPKHKHTENSRACVGGVGFIRNTLWLQSDPACTVRVCFERFFRKRPWQRLWLTSDLCSSLCSRVCPGAFSVFPLGVCAWHIKVVVSGRAASPASSIQNPRDFPPRVWFIYRTPQISGHGRHVKLKYRLY